MKKRTKRLIIVIVGFILIILAVISLVILLLKGKDDKNLSPKLKENLNIEINSEASLLSFIEDNNTLEVISEDKKIDTSKLGSQELIIKYKDNKKEKDLIFKINIIDTTKPVITFKKEIVTNVGIKPDLLKHVAAADNSLEEINVKVEGNYNIKEAGTYHLKYTATDSSNNKAEEEFTLKVMEKNVKYYEKLPVPTGEKTYEGTTSKGYSIYKINGSTYIDDILIANKSYALGENFVPENTYTSAVGKDGLCNTCINKYAYQAWNDMKADASALGLNIWIQSGYRPYTMQVKLYKGYVNRDGKAAADTYSSRPGHSEHQTGLSFDLNTITNAFANTEEGKWINNNCYKYGYIIRFPKGKDNETGYQYEPWHIRYVGTELATKLYNNGDWLSLEDYFGITSTYQD